MIATKTKLTFDRFLEECPEDGSYELVDGEILEMRATRGHDSVADFLLFTFNDEVRRLNLDFVVKNKLVLRTITKNGQEQGRNPDVSVVDKQVWRSNPAAYSALETPIQLAVEVTSTNWDDDYIDKLDEYKRLGIPEYWIVDYLAIASRDYLGKPKVPTIFVYQLVESGKYHGTAFTRDQWIISPTFPELALTAAQVFQAE
jgi:Uma2 family endonuclease